MEKKTISQMAVHINSTTVTGSSDQTQNKPGVTNWMKPQTNTLLVNSNKLIAQQKNRKKQTNSNAR